MNKSFTLLLLAISGMSYANYSNQSGYGIKDDPCSNTRKYFI